MDRLKEIIKDALLFCGVNIVKFLFLLPFNLWLKAATRLSEQRKHITLEYREVGGFWPFLTYVKRFAFDFGFDAAIFASYFAGIILAVIAWITSMLGAEDTITGLLDGSEIALLTLIHGYFAPIYISLLRDIIQLLLIPFRKFLSWGSKPAQYMDMEINSKSTDNR